MSSSWREKQEVFFEEDEEIFGQHIYERAIVDVLVKSKGHVESKIW